MMKAYNRKLDKHYEELFDIYNKCNKTKLEQMLPLLIKNEDKLEWNDLHDDPYMMHSNIYDLCYISKNTYSCPYYEEMWGEEEEPSYYVSNGDLFYYLTFDDIMPGIKREFNKEIQQEFLISKKLGKDIASIVDKFL